MIRPVMCKIFYPFYDDPTPPVEPPKGGDLPSSFTKEQVDDMLAKERKRAEDKIKETVKQLTTYQQTANMAEADKKKLAEQIEELGNSLKSKEQLAKERELKARKEYEESLTNKTKEAESWRLRFEQSTIRREISDAASAHEAFNPDQIFAILGPTAKIEEEVVEGKPTGNFRTYVDFDDTVEGRPIKVKMAVPEAVKLMTERTDRFGNLFKTTAKSGIGGSGGIDPVHFDLNNIQSVEDYMKVRPIVTGRKSKS